MKPVFTQEPVQNAHSLWSSFASLQDTQGTAEASRVVRTSVTVFGIALSLGASGAVFSGVEAAETSRLAYLPSASDAPRTLPSYGSDRPSGAAASYHTVAEGETIWDIAKRYGIAVEAIKLANAILDGQAIQAGQVLKVPSPSVAPEVTAEQPNDRISVEIAASGPILGPVGARPLSEGSNSASPQPLTSEPEGAQSQSIAAFVESEEQLETPPGIQLDSKRSVFQDGLETSDVSAAMQPERLTALPDLSPVQETNLQTDEEQPSSSKDSQVSEPTGSPEALVTSPRSTAVLAAGSASSQATHQIQAGETVWSIAYTHGVEPEALRQANQISNPNVIFPGDTLVIPGVHPEADSGAARSPGNAGTEVLAQASSVSENAALSEEVLPGRDEPEAKALVSDGIPVFDVDAIAVENRPAEDVSVVEAPPVEVDTLTLNEPELSRLAAASETLQEEASSPVAIDFDPVAETSALSSASRVLNEGENLASARNAEGLGVGRGVLSDIRESISSSPEQLLAATATSTTVMEANSLDNAEGNEVDATDEVVDSSEALLAAAPLGSEVYAPIVESPEGRVVSPDLPALPAQGEYLPEAPDRFEGYMWPAQGVLTSGYGWRWGRMHQGVDIAGPVGTPIFSAASGTVVRSGWNSGGYGNVVDIRHPDGSLTRYAHNSRLLVEEGQEVRQGQQIAEMGSTGYSTGPHLHFEIHLPDQGAVNPSAYLPGR